MTTLAATAAGFIPMELRPSQIQLFQATRQATTPPAEGLRTLAILTLPVPLLQIILGIAVGRIVMDNFKMMVTIFLTVRLVISQPPEVKIMQRSTWDRLPITVAQLKPLPYLHYLLV
jgi:hypothetical protein